MAISPIGWRAFGEPGRRRGARSWVTTACVGMAAAGDAWWAASTRPFTGWSQVAVLAGGAVVGLVALDAYRHRPAGAASLPDLRRLLAGRRRKEARPSIASWVVMAAAIVAFELVTYLAGIVASRQAFPTVSSLYDAAAGSRDGKAAVVLVWLALGWSLFRR